MWWHRRHHAPSRDDEGKERAKRQLAVAKALEESAHELALEHRAIQQANNFGPSVAAALREPPR